MERHGYHISDYEHTCQAIGLIPDVARIYDGTLNAPPGPYVVVPSSQPTAAQPPGPPAVVVSPGEVKTLLAALDEAAEYKRARAETCADCADESCTTFQDVCERAGFGRDWAPAAHVRLAAVRERPCQGPCHRDRVPTRAPAGLAGRR
jgi:hypothetical protein